MRDRSNAGLKPSSSIYLSLASELRGDRATKTLFAVMNVMHTRPWVPP